MFVSARLTSTHPGASLALAVLLCLASLPSTAISQETPPSVATEAPVGLSAPSAEAMPSLPGISVGQADMLETLQDGSGSRAKLPDLTPTGMYRAAHPVVKAVMIVLALASVACWTILLYKSVEISLARHRAKRSCAVLAVSPSLGEAARTLAHRRDPSALMVQAAYREMVYSAPVIDMAGPEGLKERVRSLLTRADAAAASRLRRGTGVLATIGAIAPFVGLFGTVWGIMNSFVGIAESRSSNLAVVAPGIAEALLATAIGLIAAIPAVVIYNLFTRRIAIYRLMLGDAAAAVERLVSRDLDFRLAGGA